MSTHFGEFRRLEDKKITACSRCIYDQKSRAGPLVL